MDSPADQRDRALDRLRSLTIATAVGATGLAALLSIVAASTIPGQGSGGATGSNPLQGLIDTADQSSGQGSGQDSSQVQNLGDDQQNQSPFGGILSGGGAAPVAVSGGSHP